MQKAYVRTNWENYPSDKTPLNEYELNRADKAIDEIDNRVIVLDSTKFDKTSAGTMVQNIQFDEATGVFTITYFSGAVKRIDTNIEKIAVNFDYDVSTQRIILTLDDGTVKYIDLSALVTQYEFLDNGTITFSVDSAGRISAAVKKAGITEDMLQPDFLADIKVQAAAASKSATDAAASAVKSESSAVAAAASETAAKKSETAAKEALANCNNSADAAAESATDAHDSERAAYDSEQAAKLSENAAAASEESAASSEVNAALSEKNAATSSASAASSSSTAKSSAVAAESFAHGGTDSRTNENIDNAEYYYRQSKAIAEGFKGALRPMGTKKFADLPAASEATEGDMYNISDEFTTTADFEEGAGNVIPAGANVYLTVNNLWDIMAGTPVTSVNGERGNVVIDKAAVGLGAVPNVATNDQRPTFTQTDARANIVSSEKLTTIFGKIAKWFNDLKNVAFTGSYKDLIDKPSVDTALSTASTNAVQNKAVASIVYGDEISTNDDWDNITIGYHVVNGGSQYPWSADKHAPVGAWGWGYVIAWVYGTCGYQIYITASSRKMYIRSRYGSNWTGWGEYDNIDTVFDGAINVYSYTSANPYITKSDGYLTAAINGYAGQFLRMRIEDKNGNGVDEIMFSDGVSGYANFRNIYVPRGMRIYKAAEQLVTGSASTAVFRQFSRT